MSKPKSQAACCGSIAWNHLVVLEYGHGIHNKLPHSPPSHGRGAPRKAGMADSCRGASLRIYAQRGSEMGCPRTRRRAHGHPYPFVAPVPSSPRAVSGSGGPHPQVALGTQPMRRDPALAVGERGGQGEPLFGKTGTQALRTLPLLAVEEVAYVSGTSRARKPGNAR